MEGRKERGSRKRRGRKEGGERGEEGRKEEKEEGKKKEEKQEGKEEGERSILWSGCSLVPRPSPVPVRAGEGLGTRARVGEL